MSGMSRPRLLVAVGITLGVLLLLAPAARAASVTPVLVEGASNKTCEDLQGEGQDWSEFKVDPPADGTYTVSAGKTVTISGFDGKGFNWSSNFGIDAVFVKAGSAGHYLYPYDPPAESQGDTGLQSPGDQGNGISHIAFCYDADAPAPSPSPSVTPTVTPTATPAPAVVLGTKTKRALAATGSTAPVMPATGALMIASGAALLIIERHRRITSAEPVITDWTNRLERYLALRNRRASD